MNGMQLTVLLNLQQGWSKQLRLQTPTKIHVQYTLQNLRKDLTVLILVYNIQSIIHSFNAFTGSNYVDIVALNAFASGVRTPDRGICVYLLTAVTQLDRAQTCDISFRGHVLTQEYSWILKSLNVENTRHFK
jgi:hypothetical protein